MEIPHFKSSLFIDTSKLSEIKKWNETGIIDGVTTNQKIMFDDGVKIHEFDTLVEAISKEMGPGKPVSVELSDSTASPDQMVKEAKRLNNLGDNISIKVPLIPDSLKSLQVVRALSEAKISVNVTTLMTFEQMVIAALATRDNPKPSFISLFWERSIDDHKKYRSQPNFAEEQKEKGREMGNESEVNIHPSNILRATLEFLERGKYNNPRIIIGSIRSAATVGEAIANGAHIVTVQPKHLTAMLYSQKTVETIEQFDEAWKNIAKK